jgi:hypothetical protein
MRCTKCGVNNVENAQYCKNCGNKLSESASKDTTKNRITKHYKKKILYIGYLATSFLLINGFSKLYEYFIHGTLNGTWEGSVILIIQIFGIVISVYFFIQVYKIKNEIMNDTPEYYNRMLTYLSLAMIFIILSPTFWV